MRGRILTLIAAVVLTAVVAGEWRGSAAQRRTAWEYKIVEVSRRNPVNLDSVGAEGWEMVTALGTDPEANMTYFFKRPR